MAEAQALVWDIDDATESPHAAAVTVWAVFEALDMVPAEADDQLAYLEARAMVADHLVSLGLSSERLHAAVPHLYLGDACRIPGDPHIGR